MSLSPALTPDEVDAPHVASIVEQFHGAWRDRADAPNSARAFTEVRFAPDLARNTRTRVSRVLLFALFVNLFAKPNARLRDASIARWHSTLLSECLTRSSRLTRLSESQAERPRLRAQVFAPRATADDDDAETDVTVVHQCLADPSDENRRVRIVQRVAFDAAAKKHRAVSCDVWMERRERSCPRGFSDAPRVDTIAPNGKAWVRSPSASSSVVATWRLTWPVVDPGPDAKDGGSTFEVEEEGAFVEEGAVEGAVAVAGTPVANGVGQLLRLPAGMWAYCGDDPLAPDEFVVVECGYDPNAGGGERERAVASRRYRKADGKLVRVTLGRERLVDAARG